MADSVRKAGNKQYLNHLDGLTCIGKKNELYVNLKAHCERCRPPNPPAFDFHPPTSPPTDDAP